MNTCPFKTAASGTPVECSPRCAAYIIDEKCAFVEAALDISHFVECKTAARTVTYPASPPAPEVR